MLETVWYLLILLLQVLQVNPQLMTEKFQIDVFVASKPAYSFVVQGSAVQGQIVDAESRMVFGEFESTRRLPQAYVIFPRQALPAEMEAAGLAAMSGGKDGAAAKTASPSASPATGEAAAKDLYPFTVDYTKALKQLVSFRDKPRQTIEYPEADRFLASADSKAADKTAAAKPAAAKPAATPAAGAKPSATGTPAAADQAGGKTDAKKAEIEIRQYANRVVLTAEFVQTVIIVNFMP